jgi:hypothetical protein
MVELRRYAIAREEEMPDFSKKSGISTAFLTNTLSID